MSSMNPALAAFLAGQSNQTDILKTAQDYVLRKKMMEDVMKRFDVESKQRQKYIDIATKAHALEEQKQAAAEKEYVQRLFLEGGIRPETLDTTIPGIRTPEIQPRQISIPGVGPVNIPGAPSAEGLPITTSMRMPSQGATGPMGNWIDLSNLTTPAERRAVLEPGELKTFETKEQLKAKYNVLPRLEMSEKLRDIQAAYSEKVANIRAEATKYSADAAAQARIEAALLSQQRAMMMEMFRMGFLDDKTLNTAVFERATGRVDPNVYKGVPINNNMQNRMRQLGLVDFPGGVKARDNIDAIAGEGAKLLNSFDNLSNAFPPSNQLSGKIGQKVMTWPVIRDYTDIGQEFQYYNSQLISFLRLNGMTSSRMFDSNKEQTRMEGAVAKPTDSPTMRLKKRVGLLDITFTAVQKQLAPIKSLDIKRVIWGDIINNNANLQKMVEEDPNFRNNVIRRIEETGNYNGSYFNYLGSRFGGK